MSCKSLTCSNFLLLLQNNIFSNFLRYYLIIYTFFFSGIAQCSELYWQLLGKADKRQVPGAKIALQQNIGLGGAVVVALYKQGFPKSSP